MSTRVLFLAWGPSIHAERRIRLFCDAPRFEVGVVSNHEFGFARAKSFPLTAARGEPSTRSAPVGEETRETAPARKAPVSMPKRLYRAATSYPYVGRPIHEMVTSTRDAAILRRAVKEFSPHVLFLQTLHYPSYLHFAVDSSLPRIITFWNGDVVWWAKFTGAERLFKKQIVARSVRAATAVTVNSKAAYEACLGYGAEPSRVHLIRYPGVDLASFAPGDKRAAKKALGYGDEPLIVAPRGPAAYQNLDMIVEAAPSVLRAYPGARFVFLAPGAGVDFGALPKRARELGIASAIVWKGAIPHADLPTLMRAADLVLSISSEDSTPNSMLEAMAAKVPLVMGDIPPIRDWIVHEKNGLLVPPRDSDALARAMLRCLADRALAAEMAEAAYLTVSERASSASQVELVKELVLSVAARRP